MNDSPKIKRLTREELTKALELENKRKGLGRSLVIAAVVIAALALLAAVLSFVFTVVRVPDASMEPTASAGQYLVVMKMTEPEQESLLVFEHENKRLVKRCVALEEDWVNIDEDGNVYVTGEYLPEPYASGKERGDISTDLPFKVPAQSYFVMNDKRSDVNDSRNADMGSVSAEQILGCAVFRIWPFNSFGFLNR